MASLTDGRKTIRALALRHTTPLTMVGGRSGNNTFMHSLLKLFNLALNWFRPIKLTLPETRATTTAKLQCWNAKSIVPFYAL